MVKSETHQDAEFLVRNPSPRLFGEKFRDSKKVKANHEKTRLWDLSKMLPRFWDPAKIFQDPRFSRYHSPPLIAHFDLIRDLLLNRRMATRNPSFKWIMFLCKTQEQKNGWWIHMDKVRPRWSLIILFKSFRFAAHFEQTRMHSLDFCLLNC